jgi:hypothetical protein
MESNNSEFPHPSRDTKETNFSISQWNCTKVCEWISEIGYSHNVENFRLNKINGYDLCHMEHKHFQNELKINTFHECNSIVMHIRRLVLKQCNYLII